MSFFLLGVSLHHSSLAVYRFPVAVTVDIPLKPTTHFLRLPGQSSPAITAGFRFYRLGRNIFCSPVRSRALCGYEVPIADEGTSRRGKKVKSRRNQPYIFWSRILLTRSIYGGIEQYNETPYTSSLAEILPEPCIQLRSSGPRHAQNSAFKIGYDG